MKFLHLQLANQILDSLPSQLWKNPEVKFLDPTCKTGVFLREIAKRLNTGLKIRIKDQKKKTNHIFTKQIFGISITEITSLMSRTVYYSKWASRGKSACKILNQMTETYSTKIILTIGITVEFVNPVELKRVFLTEILPKKVMPILFCMILIYLKI